MFIRGHHIKLQYVVVFIVAIVTWAITASVSSMKYKEESFAYYSMYRAVKEQSELILKNGETQNKEIEFVAYKKYCLLRIYSFIFL